MGLKDAKNQVDQAFTRESYIGQSYENAFGGATSFLRLKYSKELNNIDLAGYDLTGANLTNADLRYTDLTNVNFTEKSVPESAK